jgi:hypothetical protein
MNCIDKVTCCMNPTRLQLISSKYELTWFTSPRRLKHLNNTQFLVCFDQVQPTNAVVRNLVLQLESDLSLVPHRSYELALEFFASLKRSSTTARSFPRDFTRHVSVLRSLSRWILQCKARRTATVLTCSTPSCR